MCEHADDETLIGLIDGETDLARGRATLAHLEGCGQCRERYRMLGDASNEVGGICRAGTGTGEGVESLRARLASRLDADISRSRSVRVPAILALTAALLFFTVRYESMLLHRSIFMDRGALPLASFTPGAARMPDAGDLCAAELRVAPVPAAVRAQVLRDYGMEHVPPSDYELDYLITPELGGLTDARNLWPEPYGIRKWNAHAKDLLEQKLPELVCRGQIDLATAQREIASNWIRAYKKYLPAEPPLQLHARVLELRPRGPRP